MDVYTWINEQGPVCIHGREHIYERKCERGQTDMHRDVNVNMDT